MLDVRERREQSGGAIDNSVRIPLGELKSRTGELNPDKLLVVLCRGANVTRGFDAWKTAGLRHAVPGAGGV